MRWESKRVTPNHPYLQRKRITMPGCYGLRVDREGNLLIPMWRGSELINVQKITPEGEKKFFYHWCPKRKKVIAPPYKFATFTIDRPRAVVTVIAEGFATGAVAFEALPTCGVVVTFSAGNMLAVAQHEDFSGLCVVAGDNDDTICQRHLKEGEINVFDPELPRPEWCRCNPGKTAAIAAAKAIGCGWCVPSMETGSDFNDAFVAALEKREADEEFTPRKTPPHKLRAAALAPISAALMRAAKWCGKKK